MCYFLSKFVILTPTVGGIFHNFCSTGPIFKIFTFLEMALKFVCSSSSAGGRGMKIEAATVMKKNSVK